MKKEIAVKRNEYVWFSFEGVKHRKQESRRRKKFQPAQ